MKTKILSFILICFLSFTTKLFSQVYELKGGLNFSSILYTGSDAEFSNGIKMKPGFHLGTVTNFPISNSFSFQTGLLFTTKGYKWSGNVIVFGDSYPMEYKVNLLYLDIPLAAKIQHEGYYGVVGGFLGIGLTGKMKSDIDGIKDEGSIIWNDDFKRLDYGLRFGSGIVIENFIIEFNYCLGFADMKDYEQGNQVLSLSFGYKFSDK